MMLINLVLFAILPYIPQAAAPDDPCFRPHRIQVKLTATERGYNLLAEPAYFTFDSATAAVSNLDYYLDGHAPLDAKGHVYYSHLEPTPFGDPERSLRICWWDYAYKDGSFWIAGAVMNSSIEAPVGRVRGLLQVTLAKPDGTVIENYQTGGVTLSDENGAAFSFGAPSRFMNFQAMRPWVLAWPAGNVPLPLEKWFDPIPAPDRRGGGQAWAPEWTPHRIDDRAKFAKYWNGNDPRNPPIGLIIGQIAVCDWYAAQSHSHFRESFRSPFETGWQAAERAGNKQLLGKVYRAAWDYSASNVGCFSPKLGSNYFIDGRPVYLQFLNGELPDAGVRYNLTATDKAALKPCEWHEGRPEISKGAWQFTEALNRDSGKPTSENLIHWLELCAGQFRGLYQQPNGHDFEHGGLESIALSANLLADPLAKMHLHLICEEYISNGIPMHSSRSTSGWFMLAELLGYATFDGNTHFDADAERYLRHARDIAIKTWNARLDETPYRGLLGRAFEKRDLDKPEAESGGFEAAFGLAIAINAAVWGARVDPDPAMHKLYVDLVQYEAECFLQPGIIQKPTATFKGGILDSWNLFGPVPEDGVHDIDWRLRENSGNFKGVDWISDQGWAGSALAAAARLLKAENRPGWQAIWDLAKLIYDQQAREKVTGGVGFLSPQNFTSYGMHFEQIVTFQFPQ